jgi:hypothetical protein
MSKNTDPVYEKLLKAIQPLRAGPIAFRAHAKVFPHTETLIQSSKDKQRTISAHIYEPQGAPANGPVIINL